MRIKDFKTHFVQKLHPFYDEMEIDSFFYLILEYNHQLKRIDLALNPDFEISDGDFQFWNAVLEKLMLEIPIQYILGQTHFYGLLFQVNQNVLIPRPETEELVDWIVSDLKNDESKIDKKILDIGTGSGCIAVSLKKSMPSATVFALDVSEKAVAVAKQNATANDVSVEFLLQDILLAASLDAQYDVIVSNPPYVRNLEKHEIQKNVLDNEPHLALFVDDDDALIFYKKIAQLAKKHLTKNGVLYFEINQYLGQNSSELLSYLGFQNIELRQDIYGNDRMIKACLNKKRF